MNGMKLFTLLNDVDDKYVLEALVKEEEKQSRQKKQLRAWMTGIAACAAVLVLLIVGVPERLSLLWQAEKMSENDEKEPAMENEIAMEKPWEELQVYEKYGRLDLNGVAYSATSGRCDNELGELIGYYEVIGWEYVRNENAMPPTLVPIETGTSAETGETAFVGFRIIGGEPSGQYEERRIQAAVYQIDGVSEAFAVALRFEETEGSYVYYNSSYSADSFGQFAKDSSLEKYLDTNLAYLYAEKNRYVSEQEVPAGLLFEILFSEEDIPMFLTEFLPESFQYGNDTPDVAFGDGESTAPYNPNPTEIPAETDPFFADKEWGTEVVLSISVDFPLLGQKNVSIVLHSGGFVKTNVGMTGKCFYVGEEKVEEFIAALKERIDFSKE